MQDRVVYRYSECFKREVVGAMASGFGLTRWRKCNLPHTFHGTRLEMMEDIQHAIDRHAEALLVGGAHDQPQRKWKKQLTMAGLGGPTFKGFRSPRTTFANLTPRGFAEERKLVMGHSGDITLNHYVEKYGTQHLRRLVDEVWLAAFTAPWPRGSERQDADNTPVGARP